MANHEARCPASLSVTPTADDERNTVSWLVPSPQSPVPPTWRTVMSAALMASPGGVAVFTTIPELYSEQRALPDRRGGIVSAGG